MVVHGLAEGEGFSVYFNGTKQGTVTTLQHTATLTSGSSSDVAVDELVIWLRELTEEQVEMLFNFYMEIL